MNQPHVYVLCKRTKERGEGGGERLDVSCLRVLRVECVYMGWMGGRFNMYGAKKEKGKRKNLQLQM